MHLKEILEKKHQTEIEEIIPEFPIRKGSLSKDPLSYLCTVLKEQVFHKKVWLVSCLIRLRVRQFFLYQIHPFLEIISIETLK